MIPGNISKIKRIPLSKLFSAVFLFISVVLNAQIDLVWANQSGGMGNDWTRSIALDNEGNLYTAGGFEGWADFDGSINAFQLQSNGDKDVFIMKTTSNGDFLWAVSFGGNTFDIGHSLCVDNNNNVYVTGSFTGTVDFDPGSRIHNIVSLGGYDAFVCKLSENGDYIWVRIFGGPSYDQSLSIDKDEWGNLYISGNYTDSTDFDPSRGVFILPPGNQTAFVLS